MLIDLHTHHTSAAPAIGIKNSGTTPTGNGTPCSVGIHPWHITPAWEEDMLAVRRAAVASNVAAIGECGIDKLNSPATIEQQIEVLAAHARLAEEVQKPLILHCVKGQQEITALHRQTTAKQAWIIHGFRGKPTQALQLLHEGFFLSYGAHFNPDSLIATPADRLFIESDTSDSDIEEIYRRIATYRGLSVDELATAIARNAAACGIKFE